LRSTPIWGISDLCCTEEAAGTNEPGWKEGAAGTDALGWKEGAAGTDELGRKEGLAGTDELGTREVPGGKERPASCARTLRLVRTTAETNKRTQEILRT